MKVVFKAGGPFACPFERTAKMTTVNVARSRTSYSNTPNSEAEARLGFRLRSLKEVPVRQMIQVIN